MKTGYCDRRPLPNGVLIDRFWQDLRFGLRLLRKSPGFTTVAVLSLALTVAAHTAVFGTLYQIVLKPLPFPDSDHLVRIHLRSNRAALTSRDPSLGDFPSLEENSRPFLRVGACMDEIRNLSGAGVPLRAWGVRVSPQLFATLGVWPMIGRTFATSEYRAGADRVVILNHALWQERFAGRKDIMGQRVILDGQSMAICGVMPPTFRFPHKLTSYWTPLVPTPDELAESDRHFLSVIGRRAAGVTVPELAFRLELLSQGLPLNRGIAPDKSVMLTGTPLLTERLGNSRWGLWMLFAAVSCATLIGAANLINLFLTRLSLRQKEFAVRLALGASRARIVRQWLSESFLLSVLAGLIGLTLAAWSLSLLRHYAPYGLPRAEEIALDSATVTFGLGLALLAGMGSSLVPLLPFLARPQERGTVLGNRHGPLPGGLGRRSWLVLAQSAMATLLLIGAGLLWSSFQRVLAIDPGFDNEKLLTARIVLSAGQYEEDDARRSFYRQLHERVSALSEVSMAGLVNSLPLSEIDFPRPIIIENYAPVGGGTDDQSVRGNYVSVSVNYFQLMGIPLLAGRAFLPSDESGAPVVVVSETLARKYLPAGRAIGRRIKIGPGHSRPWMTIVGVAADVRNAGRETPPDPALYVPCLQAGLPTHTMQGMFLVVKTHLAPERVVNRLRVELNALDPNLALANIETMEARLRESAAGRRFQSSLMASFAALAVVLAMMGVFGVLSCLVAHRRPEIGIRMAVGSSRAGLFRLVLCQGLRPVVAGVVLGWILAWLSRPVLAGWLFGISPHDPRIFLLVGIGFTLLATLACLIPARRAASIDPMQALRAE